jgi:hypothetical protein
LSIEGHWNRSLLWKQDQKDIRLTVRLGEIYFWNPEAVDIEDLPIEEVRKVVGFSPRRIAAEIVSGLRALDFSGSRSRCLRSYTAAHGLHSKREADVELTEEKITVSHGEKWLRLVA